MFEAWQAMELFYYRDFLILIGSIVIGLILIVVTMFHIKHKKPRTIFIIALIFTSVISIYTKWQYNKHVEFIDKIKYISPAIRQYQQYPTMQVYYGPDERDTYRMAYLRNQFHDIGLYSPQSVDREISYLGRDERYFYFNYRNDTFYIGDRVINKASDVNEPMMRGIQYHLDDPRFETLGFYPDSEVFIERIDIPADQYDQPVSEVVKKESFYATEPIYRWILPSYYSQYDNQLESHH